MPTRAALLVPIALACFAGNSLLCRLALAGRAIDAATFTAVRIVSGALVLVLLARGRGEPSKPAGWLTAAALFAYAAPFSYAYLSIGASVGALVLFGAVQASMIGWGMIRGERLSLLTGCAIALALLGLVVLTLPGASAPDALGALTMAVAGVAWAAYSLLGRASRSDPVVATSVSFTRAVPFATVLGGAAILSGGARFSTEGLLLAATSGAITSGLGYSVWYAALRHLTATQAAVLQLTVPILAAAGGMVLLDEALTARFVAATVLVVGGVSLTLRETRRKAR
jgi:drug/metabolite transporter (DMT)-like permease